MKKFLSLALALVMCLSLVTISAGAKDFTDDSKITYGEAVDVVSAVGIVDGYTDGSFNPNATLTRGAAAKIITNMILGPATAGALTADAAPFKDVPANHVFAGQIAYCASQGIINGYADKSFRPSGTVTGYQFMKMLLGALGYDSKVEVYTGNNWSVNVAKRAGSVGLIDGNDSFVGTAAMTREEACLYAYNALQANMVEYETKGTTIVVGGVEISQGASSAKEVANNAKNETVKSDNVMQFAERYFKDLTIKPGTDDFGRPATVCKYKNNKIGTYAKKADATYTAEVKLGTIYSDLGLTEKITASVIDNGDDAADVLISKGNTAKLGANGVAVEVYYDSDAGTIDIAKITTYVGQVSSVKAATSTADRSIVITNKSKDAPASSFKNTYETEGFEADDIVLFTYANGEIQSVVKAESVDGELTGRTAGKSATVGGTLYKYSAQMATTGSDVLDSITMKSEVTLYLDSYGYAIFGEVSKAASSNYAYVLKRATDGWDSDNYAKLLLADGTVLSKVKLSSNSINDDTVTGKLVTYSKNSDDVYTLYKIADGTNYDANTLLDASGTALENFKMTKGTAAIDKNTSSSSYIYANSKTVFVVATGDADDPTYNAYVGIANAPSISGKVGIAYYCKSGTMLTFAVIDATDADASIETDSKTVIFVDASTRSSESVNSDGESYYTYDAVVNGEVTKIDVLKDYAESTFGGSGDTAGKVTDKLFTGVTYNSNNIVKAFSTNSNVKDATNVYKVDGDTIKLGTTSYYLASDVQVFFVDPDDGLQTYTAGSIEEHSGDKAYFIYKDGEISTLVVVSSKAATTPDTPTTSGELKDLSMGYDTTNKKFVVNATTTVALTASDTYSVVIKNDAGVTVKSVSGLACTATDANASADFDVSYAAASGVGNYNVTLTVHDDDLNKDYTITGDVVVM